jgi:hypothetical protein
MTTITNAEISTFTTRLEVRYDIRRADPKS